MRLWSYHISCLVNSAKSSKCAPIAGERSQGWMPIMRIDDLLLEESKFAIIFVYRSDWRCFVPLSISQELFSLALVINTGWTCTWGHSQSLPPRPLCHSPHSVPFIPSTFLTAVPRPSIFRRSLISSGPLLCLSLACPAAAAVPPHTRSPLARCEDDQWKENRGERGLWALITEACKTWC